jgi:uncharacterized membrane protein
MRNTMGSWAFVFGALGFLAVWILVAETRIVHIDNPQLTILNLVLSCVAALQGAILLIAAKRSDQISSELAQHDYATDQDAKTVLDALARDFAALAASQAEQTRMLTSMQTQVNANDDRSASQAAADRDLAEQHRAATDVLSDQVTALHVRLDAVAPAVPDVQEATDADR